jgi:hypothetical protein
MPPEVGVAVEFVPPLAIGNVPVTPVVSGKPVAFVNTTALGVPKAGVVKVGEVDNTTLPEPVAEATPVPPFATARVPVIFAALKSALNTPPLMLKLDPTFTPPKSEALAVGKA